MKKNEVRYIVTSVASIPVYKIGSKTEAYKLAAKPGWGTVDWDETEEGKVLFCDEDCSADIYTKNGGYFGISPYEKIRRKDIPQQAACAAILTSDSDGNCFWAEDYSLIHIFVTYEESGLIDTFRIEYGADAQPYDGETEIAFEDLYERAEDDCRDSYRTELPGTVEYGFKREAAALAQASGETWMNDEQREQFRQVCGRIDRIRSAFDFLSTMQSLEFDFDRRIINAARKFKKCFCFSQYEQPREVTRREELLEDYKKYEFVMADTMDTETANAEAEEAASAPKASAGTENSGLTEEEVRFFNDTVARIRHSVNVNVPIEIMDHDQLTGKHKEALGICWAVNDGTGKPVPYRITIDAYFVHECYLAIEKPYMKLEPHSLEQVIAHEIAHLHIWRHGKKHTALAEHICRLIEKGEPHGLEGHNAAPARAAGQGQTIMAAMNYVPPSE